MRLLVLRPHPGAAATAARIEALGHTAVVMPLFEVQPLAWNVPPPERYDAIVLTSGNAVRLAGRGLEQLSILPIYTVGAATARATEQARVPVSFIGDAGVDALVNAAKRAGHRRLLWLAGENHTEASALEGVSVDIRIVYRSAVLPVPENCAATINMAEAVLLHSGRAARHFAELCDAQGIDRAGVTLAALSPAIADRAGSGWCKLVIAATPNDAALLSRM
jgi:uroporphyrinogen-III synthase